MFKQIQDGSIITIFGGTGDLAQKKLLPAIYHLQEKNSLPKNFALVCIGRRDITTKEYMDMIVETMKKSKILIKEEIFNQLLEFVYYYKMDFSDVTTYADYKAYLTKLSTKHKTDGNNVFYLAVAPDFFKPIVEGLDSVDLANPENGYARLVIEKPFGNDLASAQKLNETIVKVFQEENTYRIDHYLGKEMLQNIMVLRFHNIFFEPVLNNKYIDQIQISLSETVGVETRANYYEHSGAIRDMVQSHILQLIALLAMDKPQELSSTYIHDEKVKVLKSLKPFTRKNIEEDLVIAQYVAADGKKGYKEEVNVAKDSRTDTFVAMKLFLTTPRFKGVPIYIKTGKQLSRKSSEIIIVFKRQVDSKYTIPNELIIKVQPEEGIIIRLNNKIPGTIDHVMPIKMDFCQNCEAGINSPEAYERLLYDALRGDTTLFARWDEVFYSWKFIDKIIKQGTSLKKHMDTYPCGSKGPTTSDHLLEKDNREWIDIL